MKKRLKIKANAKINLCLAITGKREDGYHLIDTLMQSVSLYDTLILSLDKQITVKCNGVAVEPEKNIAHRAAELFFIKTGISGGIKIKIKKRIPVAAGMGGGGADAAAVLLGLDRIYNAQLSTEKLEEMALNLGADIPFFIRGGTQRAQGIGEQLTVLPKLKKGCFLIAKTERKPSTSEMYNRLDSKKPPAPDIDIAVKAIENNDADSLVQSMDNSFSTLWQESKARQRLLLLDSKCVSLSGSGPVWFAYYTDKLKAVKAYKIMKKEKIECYLVLPTDSSIIFE